MAIKMAAAVAAEGRGEVHRIARTNGRRETQRTLQALIAVRSDLSRDGRRAAARIDQAHRRPGGLGLENGAGPVRAADAVENGFTRICRIARKEPCLRAIKRWASFLNLWRPSG